MLTYSLVVANSTDMFIAMSVAAGGRSPQGLLGAGIHNVVILLAVTFRLYIDIFHTTEENRGIL
jgi:hypothetical protein